MSRESLIATLGLAPDLLARIERAGALAADREGVIDPLAFAAAAVRFAAARSAAADRKVESVAAVLAEVRPALERLAALPGHAGLEGEAHDKAMVEVAAFFRAFAEAMNRATAVLTAEEDESRG